MTTWRNLPLEIRRLILKQFCVEVLDDFNAIAADPFEWMDFSWPEDKLVWPDSPQPLKWFSSAIKTSRDFHTIIQEERFDGRSPGDTLKSIQVGMIDKIIEEQFDNEASQILDIIWLYQIAGCFWKNEEFMNAEKLSRVLAWINPKSRLMLIPHLENWLLKNAQPKNPSLPDYSRIGIDGDCDSCSEIKLMGGSFVISTGMLIIVSLNGTVAGIHDEKLASDSKPPLVQDIESADPDSWWLFPADDMEGAVDENTWTLVNYRQKRIYAGPESSGGYRWENIWTPSTWVRDEILEGDE